MQRLSLISLAALVAVAGILALAVFVHPGVISSPAQGQSAGAQGANQIGTNSSLLSQPPPSSSGGGSDDGGGSSDG
ncbi:MAG: hypothetical protein JRM73_02475 [Nitrososphaerota archaeon]|nr:hypothetical protein [Nitrososphaerota archaeon]